MTVTLAQILEADPAIGRLCRERLPIKAAYQMARLAKLVRAELGPFFEARLASITAHAVAKDDQVDVTAPGFPAFKADIDALITATVDLTWAPLPLSVLGDVSIAAADLLALEPFLVEGE